MKFSRWLPDVLFLAGLALYVIAGVNKVPFHGDESTLIYMSRDYYYVIQTRDIDAVEYHEPPYDAAMQDLRILNGTVAKFTIGFAWDMDGLNVHNLNDQWVWEWSLDQNKALGHMPSDRLLHDGRMPSTIFTALSVIVIYGIARLAANRPSAWVASFLYATQPAVLLNGRRAMMEGSQLFFSALVILVAILAARNSRKPWRAFGWSLALGLAAGFALGSKHNAGLTVAVGFVAVASWAIVEWIANRVGATRPQKDAPHPVDAEHRHSSPTQAEGRERAQGGTVVPLAAPLQEHHWNEILRTVAYLAVAGILALFTFLVLNPTWWSDPIGMPPRVLDARSKLLNQQVDWFGGYDRPGDRIEALADQAFFAEPQYYEVPVWQEYLQDEIPAYEHSGFAGRDGSLLDRLGIMSRSDAVLLWGVLIAAAFSFGLIDLASRFRQVSAWVTLIWVILTLIGLLVLIPLEWQRYYLPLQAPVAVTAGIGVYRIALMGITWKRGTSHAAV